MTHEELLEILTYYPDEGYFRYNETEKIVKGRIRKGHEHTEYNIKRKAIAGHNLAWWYMTGEIPPKHYIRPIDGDKTNLKWDNWAVRELKKPVSCKGSKQGEKVFSKEDIEKLVDYDKETGKLYWKWRDVTHKVDKIFNTQFAGKECGVDCRGYRKIRFFNKYDILAHRIVWLLETGEWPKEFIDHINHHRDDNRFSNLREASQEINGRNMRLRPNNTSGYTGIRQKPSGKYHLKVGDADLGRFATIEEALIAREKAYKKMGYHENHGKTLEETFEE